jgi:hypothetical protein
MSWVLPRILPKTLLFQAAAFFLLGFFVLGCGSTKGNIGTTTSGAAPVILVQPVNQSIPMGVAANFNVSVNGTPPFHYQWNKNGAPLSSAGDSSGSDTTSNTYTTPVTAFDDSGSSYTVTISNSLGSVTSNPATLTVTARAPKVGDLRFEQVDAVTTVNGYSDDAPAISSLSPPPPGGGGFAVGASGVTGTPLWYGNWWQFFTWLPPAGIPGLNMTYATDYIGNLSADLSGNGNYDSTACTGASNSVVTSLNLSPGSVSLAMSCAQSTQSSGFNMVQHTVAPQNLQSSTSEDGQQGRVVTAVSYDATGQIFYLSYSWQGDQGTSYETQTTITTIEGTGVAATALANAGYIITAIGGGDAIGNAANADSVIMVGTRVQGDTLPRPVQIVSEPPSPPSFAILEQGYSVVGVVFHVDASGNLTRTWIGER